MKQIYFLLILLLNYHIFNGQTRILDKAINTSNNNGVFTARFDEYYNTKKIDKWIDEKNLIIIQSETADFPVFGDWSKGYTKIYFMARSDYNLAMEEIARHKAELAKIDREKSNESWLTDLLVNGAKIIGTFVFGYGLYKAATSGGSSSNSSISSGSNSSTSSGSFEKTVSKCLVSEPQETGGNKLICNSEFKIYKIKCESGQSIEYYYLPLDIDCGIGNLMGSSKGYYEYRNGGIVTLGDIGGKFDRDHDRFIKKVCGCNN